MREAIEALLRECDELGWCSYRTMSGRCGNCQGCDLLKAAAAVRAELAREPVELSDAELTIIWDSYYNGDLIETLRAVARAARGEKP